MPRRHKRHEIQSQVKDSPGEGMATHSPVFSTGKFHGQEAWQAAQSSGEDATSQDTTERVGASLRFHVISNMSDSWP